MGSCRAAAQKGGTSATEGDDGYPRGGELHAKIHQLGASARLIVLGTACHKQPRSIVASTRSDRRSPRATAVGISPIRGRLRDRRSSICETATRRRPSGLLMISPGGRDFRFGGGPVKDETHRL